MKGPMRVPALELKMRCSCSQVYDKRTYPENARRLDRDCAIHGDTLFALNIRALFDELSSAIERGCAQQQQETKDMTPSSTLYLKVATRCMYHGALFALGCDPSQSILDELVEHTHTTEDIEAAITAARNLPEDKLPYPGYVWTMLDMLKARHQP